MVGVGLCFSGFGVGNIPELGSLVAAQRFPAKLLGNGWRCPVHRGLEESGGWAGREVNWTV